MSIKAIIMDIDGTLIDRSGIITPKTKEAIKASGNGKNRAYILSSKFYDQNHDVIGYVRQTDIDEVRYEELVLKLAQRSDDGISRKDVCSLLKITKDQAYRLLKKLVDSNQLTIVGSGKATKYEKR